jgi:hypothetical protein
MTDNDQTKSGKNKNADVVYTRCEDDKTPGQEGL